MNTNQNRAAVVALVLRDAMNVIGRDAKTTTLPHLTVVPTDQFKAGLAMIEGAAEELEKAAQRDDDRAGMDWWNSLPEWSRADWLRRSGGASAAEAWACFKTTPK